MTSPPFSNSGHSHHPSEELVEEAAWPSLSVKQGSATSIAADFEVD